MRTFTCYDAIHLLQCSRQHVAGIRHHLQSLVQPGHSNKPRRLKKCYFNFWPKTIRLHMLKWNKQYFKFTSCCGFKYHFMDQLHSKSSVPTEQQHTGMKQVIWEMIERKHNWTSMSIMTANPYSCDFDSEGQEQTQWELWFWLSVWLKK